MSGRRVPWLARARRLHLRVRRALRRRLQPPKTRYVQDRVEEYRGYWSAAARRIDAEFVPLARGVWEVRRGNSRVRLANYVTSADNPVTLGLAGDKAFCFRLAEEAEVPVPVHAVFGLDRLDAVRAFVTEHQGTWTVKPVSGSASGLGVTTHLRRWPEIRDAALLASFYSPELMVERTVAAESCRLLYLGGELVHAVRRRGARVTGDGARSLGELMAAAEIPVDSVTIATLEHESTSPAYVPADGEECVVRSIPTDGQSTMELRTVYDESITDIVAPALADQCLRVVRALGSEFAGVDVLTNDPTVSLAESGGVFLEINTTPGIHHHYHTERERAEHPVAVRVLEHLLERGADVPRESRVP